MITVISVYAIICVIKKKDFLPASVLLVNIIIFWVHPFIVYFRIEKPLRRYLHFQMYKNGYSQSLVNGVQKRRNLLLRL